MYTTKYVILQHCIAVVLWLWSDVVKSRTQPRMVISTSSGWTPKVAANALLASAIVILPDAGCGGGIGLNLSPRKSMPSCFSVS